MTRRTAVSIFGGVSLSFAADFWKDKPASEWSVKDAHRLRERSPWAHVAGVEMQSGGMRPPGGRGGGGRRGGGGGAMDASVGSNEAGGQLRPGSGGGLPDPQPPMPEITVRWESAKPMQEASALEESPIFKEITKLSEQFYVLTTAGMPAMGGGGGRPDQDGQDRARALQQRLKQATALKRKGKPDVAPDQVGMVQTAKGPMLVFLFSRETKFAPEDKEVVFESAAGPMKVKSKFTLKDMVYKGDLAL